MLELINFTINHRWGRLLKGFYLLSIWLISMVSDLLHRFLFSYNISQCRHQRLLFSGATHSFSSSLPVPFTFSQLDLFHVPYGLGWVNGVYVHVATCLKYVVLTWIRFQNFPASLDRSTVD